MPTLSEIRKGEEIGYTAKKTKFIWHACEDCGKERWVLIIKGAPNRLLCLPCGRRGYRNVFWKGGRVKDCKGYVYIYIYPDNPFYPMAGRKHKYIAEHRLVMARHLGRCLDSWEVVHHLNGIKDDNRLENLKFLPSPTHHITDLLMKRENYRLQKRVDDLEGRVTLLEAENIILKRDSVDKYK